MGWPVTINGNTYTESDFSPYGYVTAFPNILSDLAAIVPGIAAAATGLVLGTLAVSADGASATVYDTTTYAAGVGGIDYYDFKNASGTQRHGASVRTDATTGPNGAEVADLILSTMRAGTLTDAWKITGSGTLAPTTDDGAALGSATFRISDVFLASGGVINFDNANYTLTHSSGLLTASGGLRVDGAVGIGTGTLTGYHIRVAANATGGSGTFRGFYSAPTVQSDVTTACYIVASAPGTVASSFTLTALYHMAAFQGTFGAGSTVTNQYGFFVHSGVTGATNNYGFYSSLAAASGRWNFYAAGTAANYFAGDTTFASTTASTSTTTGSLITAGGLGVGGAAYIGGNLVTSGKIGVGAAPGTANLMISLTMTGNVNTYGQIANSEIASDVTSGGNGYTSNIRTAAASFTLAHLRHFYALPGTMGAGSTIANQYGFVAESNLTGGVNNFGFYSNIASGSNRWNFYANGTAANYFAGNILAAGSYANTTASAANVFIDTDGTLKRSTSSIQYKDDVKDYARGMSDIMGLRPVSFLPKGEGERRYAGFISEELHERGFTEFVDYDADGKPSGIHYGHMTALCVAGLQDHEARIAQLESRSIH